MAPTWSRFSHLTPDRCHTSSATSSPSTLARNTLYSTGIRVGECVALKRQDLNPERMVIRIVRGKGQKDRYVPLSPMMLNQLELYYKEYNPEDYVDELLKVCNAYHFSKNG